MMTIAAVGVAGVTMATAAAGVAGNDDDRRGWRGRDDDDDRTMPPHYGKFIAYFRVSTDRQGKSGLGLAAQREAVMSYLDGGRWALVDEFTEVESGKRNDRPELVKAFAACKKQRAKLVIAKLDRLSRNLAFIATLMDSGVEFIAVDNPHANKLTIHILAAVAQHEREIISARTSAALKAAKARGKRLGNPKLSDAGGMLLQPGRKVQIASLRMFCR
jgi:DNA invertase Pin-like site-specific DNA recombinase